MPESVDVLIMASGRGERYGARKQFLKLGRTTVVNRAAHLFKGIREINKIFVVYPPDMNENEVRNVGLIDETITLVQGDEIRENSVRNGLKKVRAPYVLIHDAVRPACSELLIRRVMDAMFKYGAAVCGINPYSTVKYIVDNKLTPLDRNKVVLIQTPQGYKTDLIKNAYDKIMPCTHTDSSSVAQEVGIDVHLVEGEYQNIKITVEEDYLYLKEKFL